jgi:hypothetical protein
VSLLVDETAPNEAILPFKPEEQSYVMSASSEDVEMRDVQDEEEEEEEVLSELDPDEGIVFRVSVIHLTSSDESQQKPAMKKMKKMECHRVSRKANVIHSSRSDTRVTGPMSFVETILEFSTTPPGATSSITRPLARLQLPRARNLNRKMCAWFF